MYGALKPKSKLKQQTEMNHYVFQTAAKMDCINCLLEKKRYLGLAFKYLFIHVPVILVSGAMYCRIILTLRTGKQNARKRTLTVAFAALWLLWALCLIPYAVLEFLMAETPFHERSFKTTGEMMHRQVELDVLASMFHRLGDNDHNVTGLFVVETGLFFIKQSYGLVNSVLLIVLIRKLREPIRQIYDKLRKI